MLARSAVRATVRACGAAAGEMTRMAAPVRLASEWLQGRPPVVDTSAGTMAALYYQAVRETTLPHRSFLVAPAQDESMSVKIFDRHVYAYAKGMLDGLGMKKGDKLALYMSNEIENLVLQYAGALIGATVVTIDPALDMAAVTKILEAESVRVLVVSARIGGTAPVAKLPEVFAAELGPFAYSWGYAPLESKRFRSLKYIVQSGYDAMDGIVRLKDVPVYGESGEYDMDDIAAVQTFVSPTDAITLRYAAAADGSLHKSAASTHASTIATAAAAAAALQLKNTDAVVVTAPLQTLFGFAAGALAATHASAKLVFPSKVFDAEKTLAAITAQRANALIATHEQVEALASALEQDAAKPESERKYDVSSLRAGLIAAPAGSKPPAVGSAALRVVDASDFKGAASL